MKYASFSNEDSDLFKEQNDTKCGYKDRIESVDYNKNKKKICNTGENSIEIVNSIENVNRYLLDTQSKDDSCKSLYNDRLMENVQTYKTNKQLTTRIISTIPYRKKGNYNYNPEIETMVAAGISTGNKKSMNNTSQVKSKMMPMVDYVKKEMKNKNRNFDISRFQLSSRQIKGNKSYVEHYKKNLDLIKNALKKN